MDKKTELLLLREEVVNCTKCPDLVANRTQTVFSDGSCDASLMVCGEAPGYNEDKKGLPFVGDAGELFNNMLKACGFDRNKDVYIVNAVKCRPPNNREPTAEECGNCRQYLDRQIDIVKPGFLLILGSAASKLLFGDVVSSLRGSWHEYNGIPTICTYHPSYALRRGDEVKKEIGKDLVMLLSKMRLYGGS